MIETKPRINRGNRGQLFRATWLSSARCSETIEEQPSESNVPPNARGSDLGPFEGHKDSGRK